MMNINTISIFKKMKWGDKYIWILYWKEHRPQADNRLFSNAQEFKKYGISIIWSQCRMNHTYIFTLDRARDKSNDGLHEILRDLSARERIRVRRYRNKRQRMNTENNKQCVFAYFVKPARTSPKPPCIQPDVRTSLPLWEAFRSRAWHTKRKCSIQIRRRHGVAE